VCLGKNTRSEETKGKKNKLNSRQEVRRVFSIKKKRKNKGSVFDPSDFLISQKRKKEGEEGGQTDSSVTVEEA